MKRLLLLFAPLFAMGLLSGCSDENVEEPIPADTYIEFSPDQPSISPDGGSVEVVVRSNNEWYIISTCDWCSPSTTVGKANEEGTVITFTAEQTYESREGIFTFWCGDLKKDLIVSQNPKEAIIAGGTIAVPIEGGVATYTYQTNVECEVVIPEEAQGWISVASADATRSLEDKSISLNVAENTTGANRQAELRLIKKGDDTIAARFAIVQIGDEQNVIKYLTSDNEELWPKNNDFGASIVANSYLDGIGHLVFNSPPTAVPARAFNSSYNLLSITLPDTVTEIGPEAFSYCSSLESASIGNSIKTIGNNAFSSCKAMKSIIIPDGVTEIGDSAFSSCQSLQSITLPEGLTTLGDTAFSICYGLTSFTIPDSVTQIGEGLLNSCMNLTEIRSKFATEDGRSLIFDDVLVSIAPAGLSEYSIPDGVTRVGALLFLMCDDLMSITIPNSVTSIGYAAFMGTNIQSVTIPEGVTEVDDSAFAGCQSLMSVYCKPITPPTADIPDQFSSWNGFLNNASGRKIYVPTESEAAYKSASGWNEFADDIIGIDF